MKKILKNNSIIITALCIMIAIVWYLNYTDGDKSKVASGDNVVLETVTDDYDYSANTLTENGLELSDLLEVENEFADLTDESMQEVEQTDLETVEGYEDTELAEGEEMTDISDEDLAALEEMAEIETTEGTEVASGDTDDDDTLASTEEMMIVSDTGELLSDDETNSSTPGEAVLASTSISASYFSSAKLTREQNRAREKESLMEMMESETLSDEVKQKAVDSYLALTAVMEKENATELLLEAKGFEGVVVTIIDDCVDVVINAPTITEQQIAQIESIVKRKTEVEAENIVISAVVVEE